LAKDLAPLLRSRYRPEGAVSFCRNSIRQAAPGLKQPGLGEPPALPDLELPWVIGSYQLSVYRRQILAIGGGFHVHWNR
jgi:hypothetical protein